MMKWLSLQKHQSSSSSSELPTSLLYSSLLELIMSRFTAATCIGSWALGTIGCTPTGIGTLGRDSSGLTAGMMPPSSIDQRNSVLPNLITETRAHTETQRKCNHPQTLSSRLTTGAQPWHATENSQIILVFNEQTNYQVMHIHILCITFYSTQTVICCLSQCSCLLVAIGYTFSV